MLIRNAPKRISKWLHPSLRPILRSRRPNGGGTSDLSLSQKIRNRLLNYEPLPRVFPYYCDLCTLSSKSLRTVINHNCSKKDESKHICSDENEVRIATLGSKCKAKDAFAVMERYPKPQWVNLAVPTVDPTKIEVKRCHVVPTLADLCTSKLAVPRVESECPTESEFESVVPTSTKHLDDSRSSIGYACSVCTDIFPSYELFDDHLVSSECASKRLPDAIPIQLHADLVPSYSYGRRALPVAASYERICSSCLRDDFRSNADFHQHIFDCAKAMHALEESL